MGVEIVAQIDRERQRASAGCSRESGRASPKISRLIAFAVQVWVNPPAPRPRIWIATQSNEMLGCTLRTYLHARLSPTEIIDPAPERKFVFTLNLGELPSLRSVP